MPVNEPSVFRFFVFDLATFGLHFYLTATLWWSLNNLYLFSLTLNSVHVNQDCMGNYCMQCCPSGLPDPNVIVCLHFLRDFKKIEVFPVQSFKFYHNLLSLNQYCTSNCSMHFFQLILLTQKWYLFRISSGIIRYLVFFKFFFFVGIS